MQRPPHTLVAPHIEAVALESVLQHATPAILDAELDDGVPPLARFEAAEQRLHAPRSFEALARDPRPPAPPEPLHGERAARAAAQHEAAGTRARGGELLLAQPPVPESQRIVPLIGTKKQEPSR